MNKKFLITGACGLIGKTFVKRILAAGHSVIMFDNSKSGLSELQKLYQHLSPGRIASFCGDITDPKNIQEMCDIYSSEGIDVLVNNAGMKDSVADNKLCTFEDYSLEQWNKILNVNLTSVFLMTQKVGQVMKKHGGGSIINIGSTYGLVAPDQSLFKDDEGKQLFYKSAAYGVSKAGMVSLTQYCASYWGADNIRVNIICPGGVEDNQSKSFQNKYSKKTCLGRMARPDEYAGAVLYLGSDDSSYMTGSIMTIDGGWTTW